MTFHVQENEQDYDIKNYIEPEKFMSEFIVKERYKDIKIFH